MFFWVAFGLLAIVLIAGCGIATDWRLPLDRTDPRYEINATTSTYTFLTQHEHASVYRILSAERGWTRPNITFDKHWQFLRQTCLSNRVSRPTRTSSMPPARPGTASSTSLGGSCQSGYAIGLTTVIRFDRWYKISRPCSFGSLLDCSPLC